MSLNLALIRNDGRIEVRFDYDRNIVEEIRKIPGRLWVNERKVWNFPGDVRTINELKNIFGKNIEKFIGNSNDSPNNGSPNNGSLESSLKRIRDEMRIIGFSQSSIKAYVLHFKRYVVYNRNYMAFDLNKVKDYLLNLRDKKECSVSYLSQAISAIKFYYCKILNIPETELYVAFPKKEKKLPNVLSKNEVLRIINSIANLKHRLMLMLIYSAGLRVSEAAAVLIEDIDVERRVVRIRQSKGHKDRLTLLSEKTLETVLEYSSIYKPEKWLFEGGKDGKHISARSIQNVFKEACKKSGINKNPTVHWLRHAFATHLLESGVDLRYIQELLGLPGIPGKPSYPHYLVTRKVHEKGY